MNEKVGQISKHNNQPLCAMIHYL